MAAARQRAVLEDEAKFKAKAEWIELGPDVGSLVKQKG